MAKAKNRWSLEGVIATVHLALATGLIAAATYLRPPLSVVVEPLMWVLWEPARALFFPVAVPWLTVPIILGCNSVAWGYTLAFLWRWLRGAPAADEETRSDSAPEGRQAGRSHEGAPVPTPAREPRNPPAGLVPEGIAPFERITRVLIVVCLLLAGFAVCVLAFRTGTGR